MKNKIRYLVVGFALILFVLPSVVMSARLNDPRTDRECYKDGLPFFVCVISGTNTMEASFMTYEPMHDYYTPQLKETAWNVGNVQTMGKKTIQVGTMTLTGSPSYTYTHGKV